MLIAARVDDVVETVRARRLKFIGEVLRRQTNPVSVMAAEQGRDGPLVYGGIDEGWRRQVEKDMWDAALRWEDVFNQPLWAEHVDCQWQPERLRSRQRTERY